MADVSETSRPHSELEPAALVELIDAVGQWLGAESAPYDVIRTQERVSEKTKRLIEQIHALQGECRLLERERNDLQGSEHRMKEQLEAAHAALNLLTTHTAYDEYGFVKACVDHGMGLGDEGWDAYGLGGSSPASERP